MSTRVVDEAVAGYDEASEFLEMLLGAAAIAQRVERTLESAAGQGSIEPQTSPDEPGFEDFVLGIASFSRRFLARLETVERAEVQAHEERAAESTPRDLLL